MFDIGRLIYLQIGISQSDGIVKVGGYPNRVKPRSIDQLPRDNGVKNTNHFAPSLTFDFLQEVWGVTDAVAHPIQGSGHR
jgi:hypothetical protein